MNAYLPRKERIGLVLFACTAISVGSFASAAEVILNEYNGVSSDRWLECDEGPPTCDAEDTFFGRVMGNGGNWFELVVIEGHLDMRGWQLDWREENVPVDDVGTLTLSKV